MARTQLFPCALAASLGIALAAPASADPAIGIGFGISFGGGQPQVGAGLRLFTDDEENSFAGMAGLDYVFTTRSLRPSLGAAYLFNSGYVGGDLGYNPALRALDFGVAAGVADTDD